MSAAFLPVFELFLDDDRYAVPTLQLVPARDLSSALGIAERLLAENAHHRGIEVCLDGQRLEGLGTFSARVRSAAHD